MKKFISFILSIVFVVGIFASAPIVITANAASTDFFTFELNSDGETYCLTACNKEASGTVKIPNMYNGSFVSSIGNFAFDNCELIETIIMPESITEIGYQSFYNCYALKNILVSEKNPAFKSISGVLFSLDGKRLEKYPAGKPDSEYTIPSSVDVIANSAFASNEDLKAVTIPEGVKTIESGAFSSCSKLESFKIPESITKVGDGAFECTKYFYNDANWINNGLYADGCLLDTMYDTSGEFVIPESTRLIADSALMGTDITSVIIPQTVTVIGEFAFSNCSLIKTLKIPNTVTNIGKYCFENCRMLEVVSLSSNLKSIPKGTFSLCEMLSSINWPKELNNIGDNAFYGCNNLTNIEIPGTVKSIGDAAFYECSALKNVSIGASVEKIGDYAFGYSDSLLTISVSSENKNFFSVDNVLFNKDKTELLQYPVANPATTYNIPDTVVKIKTGAFEKSANLMSVNIPSSVEAIERGAFNDSDALTHIVIPDSVKNIGWRAFSYCDKLEKITMSKNVEKIGAYAFDGTLWYQNELETADGVIYIGDFAYSSNYNYDDEINLIIKSGTRGIADQAFVADKILSITLPDGLEYIGENALMIEYLDFEDKCTKEIKIPNSVKRIDKCGVGYYVAGIGMGQFGGYPIPGFKITGVKGTVAEKYANDNGFKFEEDKIILAAPKVTQKNTAKGISLTWGKVASAESYRVYRRTYNTKTKKYSEWTTLSKAQKGTSFVDTKVKLGTTYSYMVKAINSGVLSKGTPTKNLKYNVTPTVTIANASKGISVSWSPIANATGYEVYSSTYNAKTKKWSSFTKRATAKANAKSWTDTKAKSGTKYKYTVKALNGKVASAYNKSGVQIVRLAQPTTKIVNASNGIKVSWGKVSGATSYEILRAEYNAKTKKWTKAKKVATAKAKATSWTDTKVKSGVQYRYTVKAVNGKVYSSYKTTSGLMFLTMPKTTVKAVKTGVTVTWTQSTGATSYEVYRAEYNKKTKKYTAFKKVATAKSTAKSYTDKTAKKGVKYKYTVKAVNGKVASAYKAVVVSR